MAAGLLLLLTTFLPLSAQPTIQWDKTLGGNDQDRLRSLQQTSDGGYILGGTSLSVISGDKSEDPRGCTPPPYGPPCSSDYWVLKLDSAGNKQWDKTVGGSRGDGLQVIQQTPDGGYILAGSSVSDISGDKTEGLRCSGLCGPYYPADYWVVKLDAAGNKQWDKTFGGYQYDILSSLQQTADGGYLLGGSSDSPISFDKTAPAKGIDDYWVVKLDAAGNKQWDKSFGGNGWDNLSELQQTQDGGYILGGYSTSEISGDKTEPRRGECDPVWGCLPDYWVVKLDAAGNKQWDKTLGGNDRDYLRSIQQTLDEGYIMGGESYSSLSDDKTEAGRGSSDYWVVKLDATGNKQWDKTIGGSGYDKLSSLQQTNNGGYILGGMTESPISGEKTESSRGGSDYWVVKLDADGNKVWDKTIWGSNYDELTSLQQTQDGGYILGGESNSLISGDKTEARRGNLGYPDYWVVKLAPFPETRQVVSFTLINTETGQPVQSITGQPIENLQEGDAINLTLLPTQKLNIRANTIPAMVGSVKFELSGKQDRIYQDNEVPYALFGDTTGQYHAWSPGPGSYTLRATPFSLPDGQGEAGTPLTIRFTLFSKQAYPQVEWDKTIGGSGSDNFLSLQQTPDGGYILGGVSYSDISGEKTESSRGGSDYWVVKLDAAGNKVWDKTIGGSGRDVFSDLEQTPDGGYILGGSTASNASGEKTGSSRGGSDYWIVKLDAAGNKVWDKTIGGGKDDRLMDIQQTHDGGYILGGESSSPISGDKTEINKGACSETSCTNDYWVVKLDAAGNKLWDKTLGGNENDVLRSLQQTEDGGFFLGGTSGSDLSGDKTEDSKGGQDYWVVKLDATGNKLWDKTLGGNSNDYLTSLQQTSDRGYILGGESSSPISGDKTQASKGASDFWVVKLDTAGNKVWDKVFGGNAGEGVSALEQTKDGGYLLGGASYSGISGDKTEVNRGLPDFWVVKLDGAGNKQWEKTLGGNGGDALNDLQQTLDGGFILGGWSDSPISFDKTDSSRGGLDYWVVKLAPFPESPQVESFTLINAQSDQPLRTLNNGDTLYLAELPTRKLNIRADTHPDTVGSVRFQLRGKLKMTQLDNQVPYALFGDNNGHYNQWTPKPGNYRLTATPYARPNARGKAGTPLTIHFTVVRRPAAAVAARWELAPEPASWLMLYPNPTADGRLQVRLTGQGPGPVRYSLLSAAGRKLAEGTVSLTDTGIQLEFDFSRQLRTPGLYYLRLEGANGRQTFKIMRR